MTDVFDHEALNQPGDRSDTNTAAGRMVFSMVSAMAEFERSVISERTKAGMAAPQHTGRQWRMPFTDSIGRVVTKQLPPRWP